MMEEGNEGVSVSAWDAVAEGYDQHVTPGEAELAIRVLKQAGLEAGDRFLDVAAGTGGLALPAARLGAKVVATDWSPKMIERFEARVREEGLSDAEGRVMDAHSLDFEDDAFDVTGSLFGVMLVDDQITALKEMVRVTKPGGKVLMIAYGDPAEFEALVLFLEALQSVVPDFPGLPDDPPPLEFQNADPERLEKRLEDSGLVEVTIDASQKEVLKMKSGRELWDWCLSSNPIPGTLVHDLGDERRAAMVQWLDDAIERKKGSDGIAEVTARLNIGIGTKSGSL